MGVLDGLAPEKVFYYFEQISRIPHGSGNVKQISDYLREFAEKRNLFCKQDALGNIVIIREASPEREEEEPYVLQAHMDMVAVAVPGSGVDMTKEPLKLRVEGDKIYAQDTSLGGDDGVGVAYCLALLDAEALSLPRLEAILTVDEETGMEGATGIDLSMIQGRRVINLDQEEEGVFITSCAGGARVEVEIPLTADADSRGMRQMTVRVKGLLGGHSGIEIDRGRGNANGLLGSILCGLSQHYDVRLAKIQGGQADNAIPREAEALVWVREEDLSRIDAFLETEEEKIRETLGEKDPDFTLEKLCHNGIVCDTCYTKESTAQALTCLCKLPNGVIAMSGDVEGLVETSLNLGVLAAKDSCLLLQYAVRSSVDEEKEALCRRMGGIAGKYGAKTSVKNPYPGWAYRKDSPLREKMIRIYEKMYGKAPVVQAIHAGLECGILAGKLPGLDCVSIGPDLFGVHTAQESMSIASVKRVWEYLLAVLA